MQWSLSFSSDGSFREELEGQHMACTCGYAAPASQPTDSAASSSGGGERHGSGSSGGERHGSGSSGGSGRGGATYFRPEGACWGSDDAGCPRSMQLDDAEAQLLTMWVRTGLWVLPRISGQLHIAPASAKEAASAAAGAHGGGEGRAAHRTEDVGETSWLKLKLRGGGRVRGEPVAWGQHEARPVCTACPPAAPACLPACGRSWPAAAARAAHPGCPRARCTQVTALVEVCQADWRPISLRLCLAGEHDLWAFSDWHQWQPGLWLAGAAVQNTSGSSGVVNEYSADGLQLRPAAGGSASASRYAQPSTPLMPDDAAFVPGVPEEVPAWHTSSGHRCGAAGAAAAAALRSPLCSACRRGTPSFHPGRSYTTGTTPQCPTPPTSVTCPRSLVRPLLNGREVGYFIFDTGASGFVLDPAAGDALDLEAFGELQVTSMVGRIASRFRWAGRRAGRGGAHTAGLHVTPAPPPPPPLQRSSPAGSRACRKGSPSPRLQAR